MLRALRNRNLAPLWLAIRLFLGYVWISAALEKLGAFQVYVGSKAGTAVAGYLHGALAQTTGAHAQVTAEWGWIIHTFLLPTAGFWSIVVTFGELLVGVGLILGIFTGTALLAGALMNTVYLLSGSATVNPILLLLEIALLVVGPAAAAWGLDHVAFRDWVDAHLIFHASPSVPQARTDDSGSTAPDTHRPLHIAS